MKKNKGKEAPKELCAFKNVSQHGFILSTSQIMGVDVGDIGFIEKEQFDIINKKFAGHFELLDLANFLEGTYKRGMIIKPRAVEESAPVEAAKPRRGRPRK